MDDLGLIRRLLDVDGPRVVEGTGEDLDTSESKEAFIECDLVN